jgi:hypothetical protein
MTMRIPRRDNDLNDAIEALDQRLVDAKGVVSAAWDSFSSDELAFVDREIERCVLDRHYYLQNYHTIRDEHGGLKTLYPYWDHQVILRDVLEKEWSDNGCARIIVLKPRQCGGTAWSGGIVFQATIFTEQAYTISMAHDDDASAEIARRLIDAYQMLPFWLRPEFSSKQMERHVIFQRADDKKRAVDPGLGSTLIISNAQKGAGVAIGRTIRCGHFCLTENNLVFTCDGKLRSIRDVIAGQRILGTDGYVNVKATSSRSALSEIGYRITTWCNAAFPVEGTGNHQVMACEVFPSSKEPGRGPSANLNG